VRRKTLIARLGALLAFLPFYFVIGYLTGCAQLLAPPGHAMDPPRAVALEQRQQSADRFNTALEKFSCEKGLKDTRHDMGNLGPGPYEYEDRPVTADLCAKYGLDQQWLEIRAQRAKARAAEQEAAAKEASRHQEELRQTAVSEAKRAQIMAKLEARVKAGLKAGETPQQVQLDYFNDCLDGRLSAADCPDGMPKRP
jgi:hypothetical protein